MSTPPLTSSTPPRMDMIALNDYFRACDPQGDHSSFLFRCQTATAQW